MEKSTLTLESFTDIQRSFFKTRASPAVRVLTIPPAIAGAIIDEYGELTLDTLASFLVKKRNLRD